MVSFGFFTELFRQFVALLSVFCIAPSGTPAPALVPAHVSGPPGIVAEAGEFAPTVRERPGLPRVIQTQIDGALAIGEATARSADLVTFSVLRVPRVLAESVDRGGVLALPGGGATAAIGVVDALERSALLLVATLSDVALAELGLLGGVRKAADASMAAPAPLPPDRVEPLPLPLRVIRVQIDGALSIGAAILGGAAGLGSAVLAAPGTVASALQRGGLTGLPAGIADAGRQLVTAAADGSVGLIRAVAGLARNELLLVPGAGVIDRTKAAFVAEPRPVGPGLIEVAVRLPIATLVAASALTDAALRATTSLTGAAVTVVTNVARAATDGNPETTVQAAVARAPETLRSGVQDAGEQLQLGVRRARTGFRTALGLERPAEAAVRASGGSGTTVNGAEVTDDPTAIATGADTTGDNSVNDTQDADDVDAVNNDTDDTGGDADDTDNSEE